MSDQKTAAYHINTYAYVDSSFRVVHPLWPCFVNDQVTMLKHTSSKRSGPAEYFCTQPRYFLHLHKQNEDLRSQTCLGTAPRPVYMYPKATDINHNEWLYIKWTFLHWFLLKRNFNKFLYYIIMDYIVVKLYYYVLLEY